MHTPGTVSHRTGHTEINTMILRKATIDDAMDILTWRNDPLTRAASFNKEEIDPDSHMNWFRKNLFMVLWTTDAGRSISLYPHFS